ncbi:hypothetical protein FA13DRAFT_512745 [Coprinellus micaceus]|uniref:Uncharacterized protein n=1 Tax=Coprinellus micaceus TaxID=71717 RepID=A0A4Y7SBK1_COPMI|nr:hypothetical protein FA13DRAFT_512745 [Coprinellus micaceus]
MPTALLSSELHRHLVPSFLGWLVWTKYSFCLWKAAIRSDPIDPLVQGRRQLVARSVWFRRSTRCRRVKWRHNLVLFP